MTSAEGSWDRFSRLLDIASGITSTSLDNLTRDERVEVDRLLALLNVIDAAWTTSLAAQDAVRAAFLQKLAATRPDHPWIEAQTIQTVGDLAHAAADSAPAFPPGALATLQEDPTPIEDIIDLEKRSVVIGRAVARSAVPTSMVGQLVHWLNGALAELVRTRTHDGTSSLVFTRRQSTRRRRPGT